MRNGQANETEHRLTVIEVWRDATEVRVTRLEDQSRRRLLPRDWLLAMAGAATVALAAFSNDRVWARFLDMLRALPPH